MRIIMTNSNLVAFALNMAMYLPASKRLILFALIRQAEAKTNKKSA